MKNKAAKLDAFLQFNERNILTHAGTVSHPLAEQHASSEFARYDDERRRRESAANSSDFDMMIGQMRQLKRDPIPTQPKKSGRGRKGGGE